MILPLFIRPPLPSQNKQKGMILLVSVVILAIIILILVISVYSTINSIRRQVSLLPEAQKAYTNTQSCLAILLAKVKISPSFITAGEWKEINENEISCQYLVEEAKDIKIIKIKGKNKNFFNKLFTKFSL